MNVLRPDVQGNEFASSCKAPVAPDVKTQQYCCGGAFRYSSVAALASDAGSSPGETDEMEALQNHYFFFS